MRTQRELAAKLPTDLETERPEPAIAPVPTQHENALAKMDPGLAAGMLTRMQSTHGNAHVSRLARSAQLQRNPSADAPVKVKPDATLSAREGAAQLVVKLFGTDGLYDTMGKHLTSFENDMKTELGWYAGDKKASSKKKKGVDAAVDAASSAAKSKAKETITAGVKALAGLIPKVGGPAGTAAGLLAGVLWKEFDKIAEFDPMVTEPALKQPHQHYIEAMDLARRRSSRTLMEQVTANLDEMSAGSVEDVKAMLKLVDDGIAQVDARFYLDIVKGYRDIAPAKTIEPETPHAQYTGEQRGIWGGGTWVTPIKSGTIYVQFKAAGSRPDDIQIVRTLVPELPSDVMERFDSVASSLTLGHLVEMDELVMEGDVMNNWKVRIVKEATTSKLKWAESPSWTEQYLSGVAEAMGGPRNEDHFKFHTGAVNVYAKIATTPLSQAKLST